MNQGSFLRETRSVWGAETAVARAGVQQADWSYSRRRAAMSEFGPAPTSGDVRFCAAVEG
jgi:hypothetical protein